MTCTLARGQAMLPNVDALYLLFSNLFHLDLSVQIGKQQPENLHLCCPL